MIMVVGALLLVGQSAGWADSMRLRTHADAPAPATLPAASDPSSSGPGVAAPATGPAAPAAPATAPACPGCLCGCTEGRACTCATAPRVAAPAARTGVLPRSGNTVTPPAAPTLYTLTDAAGQGWQLADPAALRAWVDARNRQLAAPQYAPQYAPTYAPQYAPAAGCAGGSCGVSRGLFGRRR
jgi:hypothetical protein